MLSFSVVWPCFRILICSQQNRPERLKLRQRHPRPPSELHMQQLTNRHMGGPFVPHNSTHSKIGRIMHRQLDTDHPRMQKQMCTG